MVGQWLPPRQLPFRWKCDGCPLFRMIKYRHKNVAARPNWARPGIYSSAVQTAPLKTSTPLFRSLRLHRLNGYQSLAREKRAETRRSSNAIFIYRGRGVTARDRAWNINRLPTSINPQPVFHSCLWLNRDTELPVIFFFKVHWARFVPRDTASCFN